MYGIAASIISLIIFSYLQPSSNMQKGNIIVEGSEDEQSVF
jgi:SSS family solute:Na+ symporter